jgi:hypothetical protein
MKDYDAFIDSLQDNTSHSTTITYTGKSNFSANLLTGKESQLLANNNNLMKDYTSLQKTLLSHYKKGIAQVQNNSNKDVITRINTDISYLEQGLNLSEQLYTTHSSTTP